jgi:hypothetical protein
MLDLTAEEVKLLETAGRRPKPKWLIWLPALLGGVGSLGIVVTALLDKPDPDLLGVACGLMIGGFMGSTSAMNARNQELLSLIAKLRDGIGQRPEARITAKTTKERQT